MKKLLLGTIIATSLFSASVFAVEAKDKKILQEVEANIKKNAPDIPTIKEVRATPINNIYEVVVNDADIFYTEKEGKYFFFGDLVKIDKEGKVSLTQKRTDELTAFNFKELNFNDAITKKVGNGKDIVVTFEDPNCGFCKRLHPELAKLNNVTIHTFIIPILGPKSVDAAKAIWCSKDKVKAWDEYMKSNTMPTNVNEKCDSSNLQRNMEFATSHKINGTPAIYFANGKTFKGYATAEKINEALKQK